MEARQDSNEVGRSTRIFYGLGSIAEGTKDAAFNTFLLFYYNNVLGLPGTLAGLAIFLALCVDALVDPLIGSISDKTRSRWGRRHPYMYAAVLPVPLFFWLVFNPPGGLESIELFVWLTAFSMLLRASLSLYAVASNAMAAELTRRYDERTEVIGFRFLFGWIAGLSVAVIGYMGFFGPGADGSDGRLRAENYMEFGLFCGLVCATGIFLCAQGTRKLIPQLRQPTATQHGFVRFFREMREVLSNSSFRAVFGSAIFSAAGWGYINAVGYYMNTYFWGFSSRAIGMLTLSMFVSVVLAFMLAPFVSRVYDKKQTAIGLKVAAMLLGPAPIFLRYLELMPANGTPALFWFLFFHTMLMITLVISISILIASMITDITDQGELAHGERREGLYSAVVVFAIQASAGIGGLLAGLTLDVVRFPQQLEIVQVPAGTVDALGYVVGPGIMLLFVISALFLLGYRISRAGHREILAGLAGQRAL